MRNSANNVESLEILISTMNRSSLSFLEAMFPSDNYLNYQLLIINQTTEDFILKSDHDNIRVINSYDTGLPSSRNLAIENARGTICLVADDDISYKPNFKEHILEAFQYFQDADIVTFQMVDDNGNLFRNYPNIEKHTKKTIASANSVVIAVKPEALKTNDVKFNTNFGLGATFPIGNEYVFLRNALQANLKLYFKPLVILSHPFYSSGKAFGSDKLIFARAALFYKYSGFLGYFRLAKYLYLLNSQNYLKSIELIAKFRTGVKGIKKYKELVRLGLESR